MGLKLPSACSINLGTDLQSLRRKMAQPLAGSFASPEHEAVQAMLSGSASPCMITSTWTAKSAAAWAASRGLDQGTKGVSAQLAKRKGLRAKLAALFQAVAPNNTSCRLMWPRLYLVHSIHQLMTVAILCLLSNILIVSLGRSRERCCRACIQDRRGMRNARPPQAVHSCPACMCNSSLCCSACRAQRQYVLDLVQMAQDALLHVWPAVKRSSTELRYLFIVPDSLH